MRRVLILIFLFFGALVSSYFALEAFATVKIKKKLDKRLSKVPYAVSYSSIKYKLATNDLILTDFTVKSSLFYVYLGRLFIDLPAKFREKKFPPEFFFYVKNGVFSLDFPFVDSILGNKVDFNLAGGYSFSEDSLFGYLTSKLEGLGDFKFKVRLSSLSYPLMERIFEGRTTYRSLLNRGKLDYLSMTIRNRGIFERFLKYTAQEEGISEDRAKSEIKTMIRSNFKNRDIYLRIGKPLEDFIGNPVCLKVELRPKNPINLREIREILREKPNLMEIIDNWGVKVKTCS
jgi:hypothetical protein